MDMDTPDYPIPLHSLRWMAVRSGDHEKVARSLGLRDAQPCNWAGSREVLSKYGPIVFVSPSVGGWVFVAGGLPYEASQSSATDPFLEWMQEIGREFPEVQFFSEDNSCPYATWACLKEGEIVRAYAFRTDPDCEVLWNVGATTPAEQEAGYLYGDSGYEGMVDEDKYHDWLPCEESTEEVAKGWGHPPQTLDQPMADSPSVGLMGTLRAPWNTAAEEEETPLPKPTVLTEEQKAAVLAEMERTIREIDPLHLLELYCSGKQIALPEELRTREINNLEDLARAFSLIVPVLEPGISENLLMPMSAAIAGGALRYYHDQVRPRESNS